MASFFEPLLFSNWQMVPSVPQKSASEYSMAAAIIPAAKPVGSDGDLKGATQRHWPVITIDDQKRFLIALNSRPARYTKYDDTAAEIFGSTIYKGFDSDTGCEIFVVDMPFSHESIDTVQEMSVLSIIEIYKSLRTMLTSTSSLSSPNTSLSSVMHLPEMLDGASDVGGRSLLQEHAGGLLSNIPEATLSRYILGINHLVVYFKDKKFTLIHNYVPGNTLDQIIQRVHNAAAIHPCDAPMNHGIGSCKDVQKMTSGNGLGLGIRSVADGSPVQLKAVAIQPSLLRTYAFHVALATYYAHMCGVSLPSLSPKTVFLNTSVPSALVLPLSMVGSRYTFSVYKAPDFFLTPLCRGLGVSRQCLEATKRLLHYGLVAFYRRLTKTVLKRTDSELLSTTSNRKTHRDTAVGHQPLNENFDEEVVNFTSDDAPTESDEYSVDSLSLYPVDAGLSTGEPSTLQAQMQVQMQTQTLAQAPGQLPAQGSASLPAQPPMQPSSQGAKTATRSTKVLRKISCEKLDYKTACERLYGDTASTHRIPGYRDLPPHESHSSSVVASQTEHAPSSTMAAIVGHQPKHGSGTHSAHPSHHEDGASIAAPASASDKREGCGAPQGTTPDCTEITRMPSLPLLTDEKIVIRDKLSRTADNAQPVPLCAPETEQPPQGATPTVQEPTGPAPGSPRSLFAPTAHEQHRNSGIPLALETLYNNDVDSSSDVSEKLTDERPDDFTRSMSTLPLSARRGSDDNMHPSTFTASEFLKEERMSNNSSVEFASGDLGAAGLPGVGATLFSRNGGAAQPGLVSEGSFVLMAKKEIITKHQESEGSATNPAIQPASPSCERAPRRLKTYSLASDSGIGCPVMVEDGCSVLYERHTSTSLETPVALMQTQNPDAGRNVCSRVMSNATTTDESSGIANECPHCHASLTGGADVQCETYAAYRRPSRNCPCYVFIFLKRLLMHANIFTQAVMGAAPSYLLSFISDKVTVADPLLQSLFDFEQTYYNTDHCVYCCKILRRLYESYGSGLRAHKHSTATRHVSQEKPMAAGRAGPNQPKNVSEPPMALPADISSQPSSVQQSMRREELVLTTSIEAKFDGLDTPQANDLTLTEIATTPPKANHDEHSPHNHLLGSVIHHPTPLTAGSDDDTQTPRNINKATPMDGALPQVHSSLTTCTGTMSPHQHVPRKVNDTAVPIVTSCKSTEHCFNEADKKSDLCRLDCSALNQEEYSVSTENFLGSAECLVTTTSARRESAAVEHGAAGALARNDMDDLSMTSVETFPTGSDSMLNVTTGPSFNTCMPPVIMEESLDHSCDMRDLPHAHSYGSFGYQDRTSLGPKTEVLPACAMSTHRSSADQACPSLNRRINRRLTSVDVPVRTSSMQNYKALSPSQRVDNMSIASLTPRSRGGFKNALTKFRNGISSSHYSDGTLFNDKVVDRVILPLSISSDVLYESSDEIDVDSIQAANTILLDNNPVSQTLPQSAQQIVAFRERSFRNDLFSFGAVLYYLATTVNPYSVENYVIHCCLADRPPAELLLVGNASLRSIIQICMSSSTRRRNLSIADILSTEYFAEPLRKLVQRDTSLTSSDKVVSDAAAAAMAQPPVPSDALHPPEAQVPWSGNAFSAVRQRPDMPPDVHINLADQPIPNLNKLMVSILQNANISEKAPDTAACSDAPIVTIPSLSPQLTYMHVNCRDVTETMATLVLTFADSTGTIIEKSRSILRESSPVAILGSILTDKSMSDTSNIDQLKRDLDNLLGTVWLK